MFTIPPGEKWAAVCLSQAWCEDLDEETDLGGSVWVLQKRPIGLPPHWREWMGSIRTDLLHNDNLWLVGKMASSKPETIDEETQSLSKVVSTLFLGLHTTIPLEFEIAFILTGANIGGRLDVRQFDQYPYYFHSWGVRGVSVSDGIVAQAKAVMSGLNLLFDDSRVMRIRRGFNAFWQGLRERYGEDRLHQ